MNILSKIKIFLMNSRLLQLTALALKKHKLRKQFENSTAYWIQRYANGRNSGPGSYNDLAEYKADILNSFIKKNNLITVAELGCGDGNQLKYAIYPQYIGYDVSEDAIEQCKRLFCNDITKKFHLMNELNSLHADVTLSLDVIYHLVEDTVFNDYMNKLFLAEKFVIIYSSNTNKQGLIQAPHVFHRNFTDYINKHFPAWRLFSFIQNPYTYNQNRYTTTFSNFYIYSKRSS